MRGRLLLVPALLAAVLVPSAGGGATAHAGARGSDCLALVRGVDIVASTVPQLQAALSRGRLTSRELTQGYLRRIARLDHGAVKVNAVRAITTDALAQAEASDARRRAHRTLGPLDGIPVLLKDNVGTRDAPTTAGSIAFAKNIPKHEATIVAKLRAGGAVILGKTNLSEFANWVDPTMPNGYSSLGGQVKNPYNTGDPSGSSSGSGAAATLGFAALTIGTETSGSILSPSNVESVVGIKPTVGLVSRYGVIPLAQSFDTAGPMTRTVTDAAYLLAAISGRDAKDTPYLEAPGGPPVQPDYIGALRRGALRGARLGYSTQDVPSGPQGALYNQALADLRKAGAVLVPTDTLATTSLVGLSELSEIFNEFKYGINSYLANEAGPGLPIKTMNDLVVYNQQHTDKMKYGQSFIIASDATPGVYDEPTALASRTATILSARQVIDSVLVDNKLDAYLTPGASYANIGAAAGYPTVIVPAGFAGNVPMGIGFLGHAWTERSLLALAYDYEQRTHRRVLATDENPLVLDGVC